MPRQPFVPTDRQRDHVKALAAFGNRQEDIARVIGVSERTLRKYFRQELDRAAIETNTQVCASLYKQAKEGNVTAAIFWLKCRARWRERPDFQAPANPAAFEVHIHKDERGKKDSSQEQ